MTTPTQILPEVDEQLSDFDGMAHYARVADLIKGGPTVALCGKKYWPKITGAEVTKLPVCPKCAELMEMLHLMYPVDRKDL